MRTLLVMTFIALATVADAQVLGHGVFGIGGVGGFVNTEPSFTLAGGADYVVGDRFAVGGDAGLFDNLVMVSANASYRAPYHMGFVPFFTGGVSRMGLRYGDGTFSTMNVGAGADMWLKRRAGLRLEFLDQIRPDDRGTTHYWSARAGIVFR
jgi:hypothetical protein